MASFVSLSWFLTNVSLFAADAVFHTTFKTKEGVVTLGGNANSEAEKDLATKITREIFGVKKVVNTMTVGDKVSPTAPAAPKGLKGFKVIKNDPAGP